ncbi:uncharacterized protein LOC121868259 [Homarus americanus]|uniref:uncharacterized protein LOC121868259 n=1 Tax=Homarus americanus TaxID=6706 RepID=UPI001C464862|nr:uncharacterized protein LOC121868259 [Homarus americanus]
MYSFFEKSLSLVSSSPTRFGDHLAPREKRSHSLATPTAMAHVVRFQELHSRHAENHLLRTVNMATSNAVLSRISARLRAVTTATQQESVEEVDEEVEKLAAQNPELVDSLIKDASVLSVTNTKDKSLPARDADHKTPPAAKADNMRRTKKHDQVNPSADVGSNASQTTNANTDTTEKASLSSDTVNKASLTTDAVNKASLTTDAVNKVSLTSDTAARVLNMSCGVRDLKLRLDENEMEGRERPSGGESQRPVDTIMITQ